MRRRLRKAINQVLDARGLELRIKEHPLRRAPEFFAAMRTMGLAPATVIDIGVGHGTPWLMEAFPDAYTVLIEPNDGFRPSIEHVMASRRGEVHYMAAGARTGSATLSVNLTAPTSSTMFEIAPEHRAEMVRRGWAAETRDISVPVRPLDDLGQTIWPKPYLMKLDCEGFELEALKGARATLEHCQMVISEISVARRHAGGYRFADFILIMNEFGFDFFDIIDMHQYGPGGRYRWRLRPAWQPAGPGLNAETAEPWAILWMAPRPVINPATMAGHNGCRTHC